MDHKKTADFISRWKDTGGSEHANYQLFVIELTDLLGVERPNPASDDDTHDNYRFERPVTFTHTEKRSTGFIDVYRGGHFVLETKQGVNQKKNRKADLATGTPERKQKRSGHGLRGTAAWDDTMLKARNQADNYARAVSKEDGWPPFIMVVDVGHVIELYADFTRQGQGYNQFPDGTRYRIFLDDLAKEETQALLQKIWTDPFALDPSLKAAEVTRDIAAHLAELGKSFEEQGHESERVARFLMRCLFSMFAEDVELIPRDSFKELLKKLRSHPEHSRPALEGLWSTMNTGGFSQVLTQDLKRFNGGLFKEAEALPLNILQLDLLIEAANADWKQVEPAIFGTLLERALDKRQRHKLGAHYTPRAYVERLVIPTIVEPLREDWRDVQTAVQRLSEDGRQPDALKLLRDFHARLCAIRVLDPACGSGNFLYVALEMMKRLEGEVTALLHDLGDTKSLITVDPHQFLGLELNPWAASVAELVLWIGYLQWHFKTYGIAAPSEPVLRDFKNIKNLDAVLDWESRTPRVDEDGRPVTRWDGITTVLHRVTGDEVPDVTARVQVYDYVNPKVPKWPEADYIVGNPPFIGKLKMREDLGDGYVEALRAAYPKVPDSADFVMYWWEKAALAARAYDAKKGKGTRRFGLITTNSLRQAYNRRVLEPHLNDLKKPLSIVYAVPDHPWVDALLGAAVRISMTVAGIGRREGVLAVVATEEKERREAEGRQVTFDLFEGKVLANLQIGPDVTSAKALAANLGLVTPGVYPHSDGMVVNRDVAERINPSDKLPNPLLRQYCIGKELLAGKLDRYVIDAHQLTDKDLLRDAPEVYQWLTDKVKPHRDANRDKDLREKWWLHRRNNLDLRNAQQGITRFIGTVLTAKHRTFTFLPTTVLPDQTIVAIALEGGDILSILSSRYHVQWALAAGGWLGVGNDPRYTKSRCFDPFPFPDLTEKEELKKRLVALGEKLDSHRKAQQAKHPKLTLTQMYNVLEKVRTNKAFKGKDKDIYDKALVAVLKTIHDDIDLAVAEAYEWPAGISDKEALMQLVALNKQRLAEEGRGQVRWLRPKFQNRVVQQAVKEQEELDLASAAIVSKTPWPGSMPEQIAAVREVLKEFGEATPEQIARRFLRARTTAVQPLLDSLAALGQAEKIENGRYAA